MQLVILGCGGVGKCIITYLNTFLEYKKVYMIDKDESIQNHEIIKKVKDGIFLIIDLNKINIAEYFNTLKLEQHDFIIDLTTDTPTYEIYKYCRLNGIHYINTSIEDNYGVNSHKFICTQHNNLIKLEINIKKTIGNNNTCLIEFGMNPGLISLFINKCLDFIKREKNITNSTNIAKAAKIKVIHCSEIDTQVINSEEIKDNINKNNIFVNTWSCIGLLKEGLEPMEILGPDEFKKIYCHLEGNIFTNYKLGKDAYSRSICPIVDTSGNIVFDYFKGRIIHHGETLCTERQFADTEYCPIMHYVYKLNPFTDIQIDKKKEYDKYQVLNMMDHYLEGCDSVGALLVDDENNTWWCGSILHTNYLKKDLNEFYHNPTVMQVMAGIFGGILWIIENNNKGLCFAEDVDYNFVFDKIQKYLGIMYCGKTPLKYIDGDDNYFKKYMKYKKKYLMLLR